MEQRSHFRQALFLRALACLHSYRQAAKQDIKQVTERKPEVPSEPPKPENKP